MDEKSIRYEYQKYIIDPGLERTGLFLAIQKKYRITNILYPGCSVHLTPSFFFPHVVYMDNSARSADFFRDREELLRFIGTKKHYQKSSYIRFFPMDFTRPSALPECSFDLLISLYTGGIASACKRYLKIGGLLVSNNHHNDAGEAAIEKEYRLAAVLNERGSIYEISEKELEHYFIPKDKAAGVRSYMGYVPVRTEYKKNADYYIFQRVAK